MGHLGRLGVSDHWYLGLIAGLLTVIALHMGAIKMPTLSKTEWVAVGVGLVIFWWWGWF